MAPETRRRASKRRKTAHDKYDLENAPIASGIAQNSSVRRRKKGKLAWIPALPLDVLFEILYYLKFDEILRLSRLNKSLHTILLHKSSISVWRAARHNSGIPPVPSWAYKPMNEPQWASLWFDPQCSKCCAPKVNEVRWMWCVRLCKTCAPVLLMESKEAFYLEQEPKISNAILSLIGVEETDEEEFLISEFLSNKKTVFRYAKMFVGLEGEARRWFSEYLEDLVAKRRSPVKDLSHLFNKFSKERTDHLQEMRVRRRNSILERLSLLGWDEEIVLMTDWEQQKFEKMKEVNKPQQMTDRIWKNVCKALVAHIEKVKSRRVEREAWNLKMTRTAAAQEVFLAFKHPRFSQTGRTDSTLFPEIYDFCSMAPVQALIDAPPDVEVSRESFQAVPMEELVEEWRSDVYDQIIGMVRKNTIQVPVLPSSDFMEPSEDIIMEEAYEQDAPDDGQVLQQLVLATTVFTCKCCGGCMSHSHAGEKVDGQDMYRGDRDESYKDLESERRPLFFPQVMGHQCLTRHSQPLYGRMPASFAWGAGYQSDVAGKVQGPFVGRYHWRTDYLCLDVGMSLLAERIVVSAGLDPTRATPADMDALDLAFRCSKCSIGLGEKEEPLQEHLHGWRKAIQHAAQEHATCEDLRWHARSFTELKQNFGTARELTTPEKKWKCLHCVDTVDETTPHTRRYLSWHIEYKHPKKFRKRMVLGRDVQYVYLGSPDHTEESISIVRPRFEEIPRPRCQMYMP